MSQVGQFRTRRWLDIAALCADEALTVPEMAKRLGTRAGAIKSTVEHMIEAGLLSKARSDRRGQAWRLSTQGRREVEKIEGAGAVPGLLPTGERLLLVLDEGRGISAELLRGIAADPSVRWCVRLDGHVRYIVSFGHESATAVDRAQALADGAGVRALVARADTFLDRARLTRYAGELVRDPPALSA